MMPNLTLRQAFAEDFMIPITPALFKMIQGFCTSFEVKGTHSLALNSPYIGINPIYFLPQDQQFIFDSCNVDYHDVKKKISMCGAVNLDFKVASDTYNLFTLWLCHLVLRSNLTAVMKNDFLVILLKLLHYKFFTSLVKHSYPYGATENVMHKALEGMSAKFDIKKPETSTWRLLIEQRCREIIDLKRGIHVGTLDTFMPDQKILYVISDIQTRIRNQITLINREYYRCKHENEQIGDYGLSTTIDGEQMIREVDAVFDQMFTELSTMAPNPAKLIDTNDITIIAKITGNPRLDLSRTMLMKFSDLASHQLRNHTQDLTVNEGENTYYVGYRVLLKHILQDTYSVLAKSGGIDFRNRADVLIRSANLYRSSRISDRNILDVKNSVERMLKSFDLSRREATISYLKTSFVLYFLLRSFKAL
jgi:hypothetical protein